MFLIEGELHSRLLELTRAAAPREAGGLIIKGSTVLELDNMAQGNSTFAFHLWDIRSAIEQHRIPVDEISESVVLWHSHPAGGVGPSREDMRNKTPLKYHLVLAYVDGDIVPTWY